MPVYNSEAYLNEAIDSILSQTFRDFEFIIIDDASTDNSIEIVKSYHDPRIILIEKAVNSGYTESLNMGIKISSGEYIARMDSDDISVPDRFEKQVEFLKHNPTVLLCGTKVELFPKAGVYITPSNPDDIKIRLLDSNCIAHSSVMFRKKEIVTENHLSYCIEDEPAEDYNLWVKISQIGMLANIDEILLRYRVHEQQISFTKRDLQELSCDKARLQGIRGLLSLSQKETQTHLALIRGRIDDQLHVGDVCWWSELLIKKNIKEKIFDPQKFFNLIDRKKQNYIRNYFFNVPVYNLNTLKILFNSNYNCYKYFSFSDRIRFIVKGIIRFKNRQIIKPE